MSKGLAKKTTDRRKKSRSAPARPAAKTKARTSTRAGVHAKHAEQEALAAAAAAVSAVTGSVRGRKTAPPKPVRTDDTQCAQCSKDLRDQERALLVEEEVGRVFCTEACIAGYFATEIERLEREYFKNLKPGDLDANARERLNYLRWITLEEPDEIWREKTLTGDHRYALISEFNSGDRPVWCVCLCLFLRGEPSFLYLAFVTRNVAFANFYRRGERMQWLKPKRSNQALPTAGEAEERFRQTLAGAPSQAPKKEAIGGPTDGLADSWTEDETRRAQMGSTIHDIPAREYSEYQSCLDETLEQPTEIWSNREGAGASAAGRHSTSPSGRHSGRDSGRDTAQESGAPRTFHFIREYEAEDGPFWYIVVAKETDDPEQIEILDAWPTKDPAIVDRHRTGEQEMTESENPPTSRLVH